MKLSEILKSKEVTVSYEVFPPKKDMPFEPILATVDRLCQSEPDFMSVTYGAGGGTGHNTIKIADHVQNHRGVTSLAHLTCISSARQQVDAAIEEMNSCGIENILALRGDIPADYDCSQVRDYRFASDLIKEIKTKGDFCVGAACYPEGHVDCEHKEDDITFLREKVDSGVDFLTTQMFFDNNVLYNFLYRIRERGITVPVIAGIMPVTNYNSLCKMVSLCRVDLPKDFLEKIEQHKDDKDYILKYGVEYASNQCKDLIENNVKGLHFYTLNKSCAVNEILNNIQRATK